MNMLVGYNNTFASLFQVDMCRSLLRYRGHYYRYLLRFVGLLFEVLGTPAVVGVFSDL